MKDGKNVGELVAPPWFPSHRELKDHSVLKCVPSFLHQMGSTSTSLSGAAVGFSRAVNSATGADKMLQTSSFTTTPSFISLQLAVSGYSWTAIPVSQPNLLIYRPKRSSGVGF